MAVPVVAQSVSKVKSFVSDNWLNILLGGTIIIGGYSVYKLFFANTDPDIDFDENENSPVIDMVTAKTKAEQLFNAMRHPGTDEDTIYDVLSGVNFNDFVMISNAFGKRYYDKFLGVDGGWPLNDKLSLHEWLLQELSNGELQDLESYMPNVLERETQAKPMALAGINYM